IKKKVWNAFTGGKPTVKEQKELGGNPNICTIYQYFLYLFEENDEELVRLLRECKSGDIVCGDCKAVLTERMTKFILEHQKRREKARDIVGEYSISRN
ncbi:tryptophan--tRNA ligase, partial [Candidatus Bathyarchaeota archaeon]|nr:tryptophan--tRNA ligase [Candidatus Bathyarchaeota archaeon]